MKKKWLELVGNVTLVFGIVSLIYAKRQRLAEIFYAIKNEITTISQEAKNAVNK